MHQDKDRSGKWLIANHGDAIMKMAGLTGFTAWKHLPSEIVAPRRFLDGLLEVRFPDLPEPSLVLIEIESYPGTDVDRQVLDDVALVMLEHRRIPEVVSLVLKPRGPATVAGRLERASPRGTTTIGGRWPVVQLWELDAEELLADGDVGLVPWVPLASTSEPPEQLVGRCVERIRSVADSTTRSALLAGTSILVGLAFPNRKFSKQLGGQESMIESPVLDELYELMRVKTVRKNIVENLDARFGTVATNTVASISQISDEKRLTELHRFAAVCPTLDAFIEELTGS